jgi:hypothetical protein
MEYVDFEHVGLCHASSALFPTQGVGFRHRINFPSYPNSFTNIPLSVMDWIDLVQDRDQWRTLENTVIRLRMP